MRIINLVENTAGRSGCGAEHGLSFYIETEKHRLLMDTGASDLFLKNAEKLGIDLRQVDTVILSHGHYDHGGGILAFAKINASAKIYVPAAAFGEYYSHPEGDSAPHYIGLDPEIKKLPQLVFVREGLKIDEELELFSDIPAYRPVPGSNAPLKKKEGEAFVPDDFAHEQCLVIRQGGKSYLFSGCAHHGIRNILQKYRALYGGEPYAVFSGFHLMRKKDGAEGGYTQEDVKEIIATAQELSGMNTLFYTGHCTGVKPYEAMEKIMGHQIRYVHSGDEIRLKQAGSVPKAAGPGRTIPDRTEPAKTDRKKKSGGTFMKGHKFFAWATVVCFLATMLTGYKRK